MHFVRLRSTKTGEEIGIELFDQGDRGGSLGIFSDHVSGKADVVSENGVDFFQTSIGAIGRRGRYFFRIIGDADTASIQQRSLHLAKIMGELADETSELPAAMSKLIAAHDLEQSAIALQKANVFKFDFATDFWFGKPDATADTRVFLHQGTDAEGARALYGRLVEDLGFDFEVLEEDVNRTILLHGFLKNYFALGVSDSWVFGVENAESLDAALQALERFESSLEEEG